MNSHLICVLNGIDRCMAPSGLLDIDPLRNDKKQSGSKGDGHLVEFTFLVLTSFVLNRLERVANVVDDTKMKDRQRIPFLQEGFAHRQWRLF